MRSFAAAGTISAALIAILMFAVAASPADEAVTPVTGEIERPDVAVVDSEVEEGTSALRSVRIPGQTRYELTEPSMAVWGCWAPCMCPQFLIGEMVGDFVMVLASESDELTEYTVQDVNWDVFNPRDDDAYLFTVTGSGTYQVFTPADGDATHRLVLDLEYDAYADQFDSGEMPLGEAGELSVWIANHDFHCLNDAFMIQAVPVEKPRRTPADGHAIPDRAAAEGVDQEPEDETPSGK